MKKTVFLFYLLLSPLYCLSQDSLWTISLVQADEMLEQKECVAYSYSTNIGRFVYWSDSNYMFKIYAENTVFDFEPDDYPRKGLHMLVGLYDSSNKLIEKFKLYIESFEKLYNTLQTRPGGAMTSPYFQCIRAKKILKHISEKKGSVRFLIPRYNDTHFDFIVPCRKK